MAALWTSADAATATGGRAATDWAATGVSIDTRSIMPGDLFVALKDARDGHEFVAQALDKGAAAALVSRVPDGVAPDAPLLIVDDVLTGLERLGKAARARTNAQVIAVTGSAGKTSTKEMLRDVLAGQGRVHAAEASYNNHWGVPLTLARMPADADFAVIEIGMNHPGEIAPLVAMAAPNVAIVTTVVEAHLAAFAALADIAREKAAIFGGLVPGGTAIYRGDLPVSDILRAAAQQATDITVSFGATPDCALSLTEVALQQDVTIAHAQIDGAPVLFKLNAAGRHFAENALSVLATVRAVGGDLGLAVPALGRWAPPAGRGLRERRWLDSVDPQMYFDLIDDAFNANPAAMRAALEVLAASEPAHNVGRIAAGRRIAVLGDMLELGADEGAMHAAIAELPDLNRLQLVHCVGPRMRALYDILPAALRGEWVETAPELAARASALVDAGDVVLVKGSKGSRVSLVVDALRKLGHSAPNSDER